MNVLKKISLALTLVFSTLVGLTAVNVATTNDVSAKEYESIKSLTEGVVAPSQYTNLFVNGSYYGNSLKVQLRYEGVNLIIPSNWNSKNPTQDSIVKSGIGLVVDGVFHDVGKDGFVEITSRGVHEVRVVGRYENDGIVFHKDSSSDVLERFYVYFERNELFDYENHSYTFSKTTFFYQHYLTADEMANDVVASVEPNVSVGNNSAVKNETFNKIKKFWADNVNKSDYGQAQVDYEMPIYNSVKNQTEKILIKFRSVHDTQESGKIEFECVGPLFIETNASYFSSIVGMTVVDACYKLKTLGFNPDYDFSYSGVGNTIPNNFTYKQDTLKNTGQIPTVSRIGDLVSNYKLSVPLKYCVVDNFGKEWIYERDIYIINPYKIQTELIARKNGNINHRQYLQYDKNYLFKNYDVYTNILINGKLIKTYKYITKKDCNDIAVNVNKVGSYNINYTFQDSFGNKKTDTSQFIVLDENKPTILAKYQIIYLDGDEMNKKFDFTKYFKIFDDVGVDSDINKTWYKLIDTDYDNCKIAKVHATDFSGNEQELQVYVYYNKGESTLIQKYAKWLRDTFGKGGD